MLDLIIRNGTVIDGTGGPPQRADVGVKNGRIVTVGNGDDSAAKSLDADGLFVAPGFVDIHTHYDAQLFWDPAASPSPLHGVTTVIGGNCGFSLAPAGQRDADYLRRMMARVEGMPLTSLEKGLDWAWTSFGSWLDRLEGNVGVNAGFLVGHSTLRRSVMGDDAVGNAATDGQIALMVAALRDALTEGALGFSTSQAPTHHDGAGDPVPSRFAGRGELEALAGIVRHHPGTTVEMILPGCLNGFTDDEFDLMATISVLADRPVNWNLLSVSASKSEEVGHQLSASDKAAEHGGTVVALTLPSAGAHVRLSFLGSPILEGLPGWAPVMALPNAERIAAFSSPAVRERLRAGAASKEAGVLRGLMMWDEFVFDETFSPDTAAFEGRSVRDVAAERGEEPFDVVLDAVAADDLRTSISRSIPGPESDWEAKAKIWTDPRTVVGGSDAGAHLDMMCGATYSTTLLAEAVRTRSLLSWEEAIRQLTDIPARLYGLRDRGRIAVGQYADIVIFDPDQIGYKEVRRRDDLPGGAARLYAEGIGIEHVLVNGVEIVLDGELAGTTPGMVLRSGRDTATVRAGGSAWLSA